MASETEQYFEYGFLEGRPPGITKSQCCILNMRRDYGVKHKAICERGYFAPYAHYTVIIGQFEVRTNFDAEHLPNR